MMRLVVVACFSGLSLVLVGCSSGTAKYGNPVAPPPATAAPTFSVASGSYNSVQTVSIPDATAGAAIYFTTNGTVPTASSTAYIGPIKVSSTETLMAVAIAPGDASGDYSHQMPYTFYAKEFIGISAPVVTPLSAGVKNHTLGSRP